MKAIVYEAPGEVAYTDVPDPKVGPDDVLITVKACGICGTDLHIYEGEFISQFPLIPGHEFSGIVEEVGSQVTHVKPGDRVTVDNAHYCRECYYCRINQEHFCRDFRSQGVTEDGGFAEYTVASKDRVYKIDGLSFEEGAFTEPTACVVHGLRKLDLQLGDEVLLFGAGPIGLLLLQLLRQAGAASVVVGDPNPGKLEKAQQLGAAHTFVAERKDFAKQNAYLKELMPLGFDVVIDGTGRPEVVESAFQLVRNGGKVHFFGVCPKDSRITVSPYDIFLREIKAIGTFAQLYTFTPAIKLLQNGAVNVEALISHRFPLADFEQALEVMRTSHDRLKIMIKP